MIDLRCYECEKETGRTIEELGILEIDIVEREYIGNGKFKCPRCGHILNLESETFHTIIAIDVDKSLFVIKTIVSRDGLGTFYEDLQCFDDLYKNLKSGVYDCDVYWHYYRCGGYEYPNEYDVDVEFFKCEEIELPVTYEKVHTFVSRRESQKQALEMMKI